MTNLAFEEQKSMSSNVHQDYPINLEFGEGFVKNYNETPHSNKFEIKTCLGTNNQEKFFMFSYSPEKGDRNANPVNPNKIKREFDMEFFNTFAAYRKISQKWW